MYCHVCNDWWTIWWRAESWGGFVRIHDACCMIALIKQTYRHGLCGCSKVWHGLVPLVNHSHRLYNANDYVLPMVTFLVSTSSSRGTNWVRTTPTAFQQFKSVTCRSFPLRTTASAAFRSNIVCHNRWYRDISRDPSDSRLFEAVLLEHLPFVELPPVISIAEYVGDQGAQ